MKKVTRFGVIVFIVGVSLLFVTFLRADSSITFGTGNTMGSFQEWVLCEAVFTPRMLSIDINTNATTEVYILDESGINLWKNEALLRPLWNVTNAEHNQTTIQITHRGTYGCLLHNPTRKTVGDVYLTLYGIENDLLWMSIALIIFGPAIAVLYKIVKRKPIQT
jgi:hypothetical protein